MFIRLTNVPFSLSEASLIFDYTVIYLLTTLPRHLYVSSSFILQGPKYQCLSDFWSWLLSSLKTITEHFGDTYSYLYLQECKIQVLISSSRPNFDNVIKNMSLATVGGQIFVIFILKTYVLNASTQMIKSLIKQKWKRGNIIPPWPNPCSTVNQSE